jgi:uncharacterized protein YxjI
MRQKLVLPGDDYWIESDLGSHVYFVVGKAFRLGKHLGFQDTLGKHLGFQDTQSNELAAIQERVMRIKNMYRIYPDGSPG